ncbi:hypothetical protein MASR1M59_21430 [Melaminivora sp.]
MSRAQVSGQSCGQAPRTVLTGAALADSASGVAVAMVVAAIERAGLALGMVGRSFVRGGLQGQSAGCNRGRRISS